MRIVPLVRPLLRSLPFQAGKGRLASFLDLHKIPAGELARMKSGVTVKLYADAMYRAPYLYGEYEVQLTKLMQGIVQPGDVCLDIGANFGYYTAVLSKLAGPTGAVHAFEPVPTFYSMATETVFLNDLSSIAQVHNFGLGEATGSFTVYTFSNLPQGHASSRDLNRADATPHKCLVTTLDTFVSANDIARVDFMKVDVEGDELSVFRGARSILSAEDAPAIIFEINTECLFARGITSDDVQAQLQRNGYSVFCEVPNRGPIRRVIRFSEYSCDYLALKENRASRLFDKMGKVRSGTSIPRARDK
jgi:FkbM family methyltransferase